MRSDVGVGAGVAGDTETVSGSRRLVQALFQAGVVTGRYHHGHRTLMAACMLLELVQVRR